MYRCQNCGWVGDAVAHPFPHIPDFDQRVEPGEVVPAGECPECRALAYDRPQMIGVVLHDEESDEAFAREFATHVEADAFLEGVRFVNDSAINADNAEVIGTGIELITRRLECGDVPRAVAADLDINVVEEQDYEDICQSSGGCGEGSALVLPGWVADDGLVELECPDAESGRAAAQEYVDNDDNDDKSTEFKTTWSKIWAWRRGLALDGDGNVVEVAVDRGQHKVEVHPDEPDCVEGFDHDWRAPIELVGGIKENPGCWGHGGGVVIHEICVICGCRRITDTWAQDMEDGQQGLRSIEYQPDDDTLESYFDSLDVGDLHQNLVDDGEDWAVFLVRGPFGHRLGVVYQEDESPPEVIRWDLDADKARREAADIADDVRTAAEEG